MSSNTDKGPAMSPSESKDKREARIKRAWARLMSFLLLASVTISMVAGIGTPVAAQTAFGINGTQIDSAFGILNNNILPDVGQTISAMPAIIIPMVILVVLVLILLFVPELLQSLIHMVKEAMAFKKT